MSIELGAPVHCLDDHFGEVREVVVDPISQRVTHFAVIPALAHALTRLVPAHLAEEINGTLVLSYMSDDMHELDPLNEWAYIRVDALAVRDPGWAIDTPTVLAHPYFPGPGFRAANPTSPPALAAGVPREEVEIRRSSAVFSADGQLLGHVDGFVVEPNGTITHLVLAPGHVFGRSDVTIPIIAVGRSRTEVLLLLLTADGVAALPSVAYNRGSAAMPAELSMPA